jgi:hypothetical protein
MDTAKQIVVRSVIGVHYFTCQLPWACISIVTEENTWPEINEANRTSCRYRTDEERWEGDSFGAC